MSAHFSTIHAIVLFLFSLLQSSSDFQPLESISFLLRLHCKYYKSEVEKVKMLNLSSSCRRNKGSGPNEYDYEKLFRSPGDIKLGTCRLPPPIEPSPLLLDSGEMTSENVTDLHLISPHVESMSFVKSDTHDAALLLASIKKLAAKETLLLDSSKVTQIPTLEQNGNIFSKSSSRQAQVPGTAFHRGCSSKEKFQHMNELNLETGNTHITETRARARTVSVDSQHLAPAFLDAKTNSSSFRTDALPIEKISLDLTSNQTDSRYTYNIKGSLPAQISPPNSPVLNSINVLKQKGPQRIMKKKRQQDHSTMSFESNPKKKKHRARPSILRSKEVMSKDESNKKVLLNEESNKKVLKKKFSWKSYPPLEDFLIANREEYLRHSAMNYTMQQKEYNNRLTERLLQLASDCGYVFDEECFSFVSIRDRIRCYFKSYVQSKKKRGLILGYAARRKGLISEEELEKSAGIKGTIIVPNKSTHRNN